MLNKVESISEELSLWRRQPVYGDSSVLIIHEPMVNRKTMDVYAFVQSEGEKERSVPFFSASRSSSWGRYVWSLCGRRIKDWELIQFSRWLKKIATSFCEFKRLTNVSLSMESVLTFSFVDKRSYRISFHKLRWCVLHSSDAYRKLLKLDTKTDIQRTS